MKIIKYFGLSSLIVFLLFVSRSTGVKSQFDCSGKFSNVEGTIPASVNIIFNDYIWWLSLWKNSDASLTIEIPNEDIVHSGHVLEAGGKFQVFDPENNLIGHLSKLDMKLNLNTNNGLFIGTCN